MRAARRDLGPGLPQEARTRRCPATRRAFDDGHLHGHVDGYQRTRPERPDNHVLRHGAPAYRPHAWLGVGPAPKYGTQKKVQFSTGRLTDECRVTGDPDLCVCRSGCATRRRGGSMICTMTMIATTTMGSRSIGTDWSEGAVGVRVTCLQVALCLLGLIFVHRDDLFYANQGCTLYYSVLELSA